MVPVERALPQLTACQYATRCRLLQHRRTFTELIQRDRRAFQQGHIENTHHRFNTVDVTQTVPKLTKPLKTRFREEFLFGCVGDDQVII